MFTRAACERLVGRIELTIVLLVVWVVTGVAARPVLAQVIRQQSQTGKQRVNGAHDPADALDAAIDAACKAAHADFPVPRNVHAVVVPSANQFGKVIVSWSPVAGVDASAAYDVGVHFLNDAPGVVQPDEPLVPHNDTSLTLTDLPLFFPVEFSITAEKQITAHLNLTNRPATVLGRARLDTLECRGVQALSAYVTPSAIASARPVWGFADTHTHQFADRAFGGQLVIGQAFGDPATAFAGDYIGHGVPIVPPPGHDTRGYPDFAGWPTWDIKVHQQMYSDWLYRSFLGGLRLMVTLGVNNETLCLVNAKIVPEAQGAVVGGLVGTLVGWIVGEPVVTTVVGASLGGTIGSVVSNGNVDCDDMDNADAQISGAYEMEAYLDSQCVDANGQLVLEPPRCPLRGKGWYHVVTSAADARATINSGRLAVVLGIEVDRLFGCALSTGGDPRAGGHLCTKAEVDSMLSVYYSRGVRHIFPAHLANTAFAGMALYEDQMWNFNNKFLNGQWLAASAAACRPHAGIRFDFNNDISKLIDKATLATDLGIPAPLPTYDDAADCNEMGLTDLGTFLIQDLMAHHMIIDVDHMSLRSRDSTYALTGRSCYPLYRQAVSPASCYPLIAGHTGFLGAARSIGAANENAKTDDDLAYIRNSGGLVAAGLNVGADSNVVNSNHVPNDCNNSSKSWAQSYLYAVNHMGGKDIAAVAAATDQPLNDFPGPRFDAGDNCPGGGAKQSARLTYPIALLTPGRQIHIGPSTLGNRTWDFNTDGMAHIGMYPDLIADLLNVGMDASDFQPLFRSAEQYIEMWEKAESTRRLIPPPPPPLPKLTATVCRTTDGVNCAAQSLGAGNQAGAAMLKAKITVKSDNGPVMGAAINVSGTQLATTDANGAAVVTYPSCVETSPKPTTAELVGGPATDPRGHPLVQRHRILGTAAACYGFVSKAGFQIARLRLP